MRVTTVVLGDLGRSPRMQCHAEALAAHDVDVDVVACAGTRPHAEVRAHPRIICHLLPPARERCLPRGLLLPIALGRVVIQTVRLVWMLATVGRKPDVILVQNPPAVPTLLIAAVAARLRRARLGVDWHSLGWAVLALAIGHPVVALAGWYERCLGRRADTHRRVTDGLAAELRRWGLAPPIAVLRDRPAARFAPLDHAARRATRRRRTDSLGLVGREPAIVVSKTSWTRDEDFDPRIDAVQRGERLMACRPFPDVLVLHGAGLPVCALDDGSRLDEILRHEETGLRFADAETLARQWVELLATFPEATPELDRLRANVARARATTWRDGWEREAREILLAHA
jgi:beta-1,4-mannosyltransferase